MGCGPKVAAILTKLSTYKFCLPQGSPCSPVLANLILFDFDSQTENFVKKRGGVYTRTGDDIIISSNNNLINLDQLIISGLKRNGLKINQKKTKRGNPNKSGIKVLGVIFGSGIFVSRKYRREVKAILHNAEKTGLEGQNLTGRYNFRQHLTGRIDFIKMFDPQEGLNLMKKLDSLKN